jgi:hypothetical protein
MIWTAFWDRAIAIASFCAPMLRPICKDAFPSLFASAKGEYSTQPASGPILNKDNTFKRLNEMDIEFPLTQVEQGVRSAYVVSLNDQLQDVRSQPFVYHRPRSVAGDIKGHS